MKKICFSIITLSVAVLILAISFSYSGQRTDKSKYQKPSSITTRGDWVVFDVNNISTFIRNNGSFNRDPGTGNAGFEWPKGTGNTANYASGIWLGGLVDDTARVAVAEYSYEFDAGPIEQGIDPEDSKYKVYKIRRGDNALTNPDYANWPFDQGAPYVLNGDGNKIPKIIGDMTVFTVFNDNNPELHTNMNTKPLGIEVQLTAFAFNRSDALGNTIYYKWKLINKGGRDIKNAYVTVWTDIDLGDSGDDYDGCDTTLGLGYTYNADPVDGVYGSTVPATGFDFLQGPLVPGDVTDTARFPDGRIFPGMKFLKMTSFLKYSNDATDLGNPNNGQEVYNYMQGYTRSGLRIQDDLGNPADFMFPGDPNLPYDAATNWIEQGAGGDRRFLMSAGPFNFAPGDTQEIVAANLIAQGSDYHNSVTALKNADKAVQLAYELDFNLASPPPAPEVVSVGLDNQIVLYWGKNNELADEIESFNVLDPLAEAAGADDPYYKFEGYVVYQVANKSGDDPRVIQIFDVVNNVKEISDQVFDPAYGTITKVVKAGSDKGVQRSIKLTMDKFTNDKFYNGKDYYFAVTSYTYNRESVPKTLESPMNIITVRPTKQPGTRYASSYGDTLEVNHKSAGLLSDGKVLPIVVDPKKITGDSYKVVFSVDTVTNDFVWSLINTTTGEIKLSNQTNQSGDGSYPILDGMLVKVISPPAGINVDETYWSPDANFWLRDLPGAGGDNDGGGLFVGKHFFDSNLGAADLVKVELRFDASHPQKAYRYVRFAGPTRYLYQDYVDVPFTAWDITADPPRQLNIAWSDRNPATGNGIWDPNETSSGGREYTFILKSDYSETPADYYTSRDLLNNADEFDVIFAFWPQLVSGHTLNESVGSLTITPYFINAPKDTFFFSTKNYVPISSIEIAKQDIDLIMAVPNPYFGANAYERNQFGKVVRFTNLPKKATIRIFNLASDLVKVIEKDDDLTTADWDLRNQNDLPVASGMYVIYIDMPNIGTKILKLAVIQAEERLDNF